MSNTAIQPANPSGVPSKDKSYLMFNRISHRYDLLNRVLSGRQDVAWRKKLAKHLPSGSDLFLLDMATGTGDVAITLLNHTKKKKNRVTKAIGMDMSEGMLEHGRVKVKNLGLDAALELKTGDAENIPAEANTFDVATNAFGIRNLVDFKKGLGEMLRVLKPGGRALVLEFSIPKNPIFRAGYLTYFRHVLPRIGAIVSGDAEAYSYLNQTAEAFPYGQEFLDAMTEQGFTNVKATQVTFGIATIYQGDKPA